MRPLVRLGRDHACYGHVHVDAALDGRWAAAISPGSDRNSPSRRYKGDLEVPNEDALAVVATDDRTAILVADSHFGAAASHELVEALATDLAADPPGDLDGLRSRLVACHADAPPPDRSETTLAVAVLDHVAGRGFGLSFGDSTLTLLTVDSGGAALHPRELVFVTPWSRAGREQGHELRFELPPEALFLAFTDGIDECHYGHPESSLRPRHLQGLLRRIGPRPEPFVRALTELALGGVDGHPGGQDNVALVACTR